MAESVFPSKDLAKLSFDFVAVIGHQNSDHGEHEYYFQGEKKHLCAIYDLPDCKAHEEMARALSQKGLLKGVRGTPTHILYNPHDLTEISRAHSMSVSQIEDAVAEAQKKLGKPVRWREYSKMRETLDATAGYIAEKEWRKAVKELRDFDAEGMKNLEAEAAKLKQQILDAGNAMLDEARAAIEAGDDHKAREILRDARRDFDRTEIEDKAKELFNSLKD